VKFDDAVDPGDAALQELLASMAEYTQDFERRDRLLDHLLTMPPLVEWSPDALDKLRETCRYIISLARLGRELERLTPSSELHSGWRHSDRHVAAQKLMLRPATTGLCLSSHGCAMMQFRAIKILQG
jgi:hypothetical protein